jgi:hypothetical protein
MLLGVLCVVHRRCFFPAGGQSVAETLFSQDARGRFGKLPVTYYAYNFTVASVRPWTFFWFPFTKIYSQSTMAAQPFFNMNMTASNVSPGRTYKYLNDSSYALWPFGYGLSYTEFALSSPGAAKTWRVTGLKDSFQADIKVTNVGPMAGDEVVFLFLNASSAVRNNSAMLVAIEEKM